MQEKIMVIVEMLDKGFVATSLPVGNVALADTQSLQKELNGIIEFLIKVATQNERERRFTIEISLRGGRSIDSPEL